MSAPNTTRALFAERDHAAGERRMVELAHVRFDEPDEAPPKREATPKRMAVVHHKPASRKLARKGSRLHAIDTVVAEAFDLLPADLHQRTNAYTISRPRQIAIYLAYKLLSQSKNSAGENYSTTLIGKHYGLDHSTIVHAMRAVEERLIDSDYAGIVEGIQRAAELELDAPRQTFSNRLVCTIEGARVEIGRIEAKLGELAKLQRRRLVLQTYIAAAEALRAEIGQ